MANSRKQRRSRIRRITRNPDYDEGILPPRPRYIYTEDGKRLVPLAMLNTPKGRRLMDNPKIIQRPPPGRRNIDTSTGSRNAGHLRSRQRDVSSSKKSIRMSSSRSGPHNDFTMPTTHPSRDKAPKSLLQNPAPHKTTHRAILPSQLARTIITMSPLQNYQKYRQHQMASTTSPPPHRYPGLATCATCVLVPEWIYSEYLGFFPNCPTCGHMSKHFIRTLPGTRNVYRVQDGARLAPNKSVEEWMYATKNYLQRDETLPLWGENRDPKYENPWGADTVRMPARTPVAPPSSLPTRKPVAPPVAIVGSVPARRPVPAPAAAPDGFLQRWNSGPDRSKVGPSNTGTLRRRGAIRRAISQRYAPSVQMKTNGFESDDSYTTDDSPPKRKPGLARTFTAILKGRNDPKYKTALRD